MLDEYKEQQQIGYQILKNAIINEKYSHAYLIETNGFCDSFNFCMSFAKSLLCPKKKLTKENCEECHQCEVIDSGNFPEIKIINSDGMWIKKEQLQELQTEFNEKALIGNKKVYIINHAEKLNKSSANSILKFLEEPENNIVAILLTDNLYSILETIKSRCQIIRLKNTNVNNKDKSEIERLKDILFLGKENSEELITSEETTEQIEKVIDFVIYYEKHHKDTLLYINKLFSDHIKTKEELEYALEIIILYYKDTINKKLKRNLEIFNSSKEIEKISKNNTLKELCKKINIIMKAKQKVRNNANQNLLMDKLIIDLEGGI